MLKRIACVLLLLPALVFAERLDSVVAIVNDGVVTESELNTQVNIMRQQLIAKKMPVPEPIALRKQVLQHLIDVDLQLQLAKKNNIKVEDADLNLALKTIAQNNKITLENLRAIVEKEGLSWNTYRENIRKEMLLGRLQQKAVGKEVVVTPEQVEEYLKKPVHQDKTQFTYQLQNIVVPVPEEPTPEQLKKAQQKAMALMDRIQKGANFSRLAIEESSGEFALEGGDLGMRHLPELPDIFANQVVKMKVGQVSGPIRTGNGYQLIKLVAMGGDNQKHEVIKTHVRHILLKQEAQMTTAEASKQANNIYQQLQSGKDFAQMAKQYSLDLVSATKGGDLGWVTPGELVPEFEETMDALPLNKISKPVKSPFGWHLIQVLGRKKVDDSVEFKRQQVRMFLHEKKFGEAVQTWQQHLRAEAFIQILDKKLA